MLEPTTAITLEVWVSPAAVAALRPAILSYGDAVNVPHQPYLMLVDEAAAFTFGAAINGAQVGLASTTKAVAGQKHHLVGTYDGKPLMGTMKLYVDGKVESTTTTSGTIGHYDVTNGLGIGTRINGGDVFNGTIDEVAIYGAALGAPRIMAHSRAAMGL